jgi:Na+/H+-dicarboxylate symporter
MNGVKRLGKILGNILIVFAVTSLIAGIIAVIAVKVVNPIEGIDTAPIKALMESAEPVEELEEIGVLGHIVKTFTVSDFSLLLSRSNMLQLLVFSVLFGIAAAVAGDKGKPIARVLSSGSAVVMKMVDIIMYLAPIGLGAYFASIIGQLGPQILSGYAKSFVLYLVISLIYYFGFFTLYAYISAGRDGVKVFWKNIIAPSVTAIATCSSAANIPMNLKAVKKIGVTDDIAETIVPLGANIHKDGSVIGGVLKIVFLLGLFGKDFSSISSILGVIAIAFLVGAVMGAIPGGGMIGEMLIISVYGFPPEALPIIAVISTIIDAPATLLNSTGDSISAMLVARLVEGKNWLQEKLATT